MDRASYPGSVYVDLLEQVSDGVYFVNTARRITYWNTGAVQLTGYTPEEVLGRRCSSGLLRHVDDTGCELCQTGCPLAAVMADGSRAAPRCTCTTRTATAWRSPSAGTR